MCHAEKLLRDEGRKVDRNGLSMVVFARMRSLHSFILKTMRSHEGKPTREVTIRLTTLCKQSSGWIGKRQKQSDEDQLEQQVKSDESNENEHEKGGTDTRRLNNYWIWGVKEKENLKCFHIYGKWLGGSAPQEKDTGLQNPTFWVWGFCLGWDEGGAQKEMITSLLGKLSLRCLTLS